MTAHRPQFMLHDIKEETPSEDAWALLEEKVKRSRENNGDDEGAIIFGVSSNVDKEETSTERDRRLQRSLRKLQSKKYETYRQKFEDRIDRRSRRDLRRAEGEEEVSEDSEDEEIDGYAGLEEIELHIRIANQAKEVLRNEEVHRLLLADKRAQNTLQNMALKQEASAADEIKRRTEEIIRIVDGYKVLRKQLVIQESLSCIHTTLEMCLIGLKEVNRFLTRSDIQKEYEKASLEQCVVSLETIFEQRKSPIQVKVEMLWRFGVIMQDFMHGSRQRSKYLELAKHAYKIIKRVIDEERSRRQRVRVQGTDEEKGLLVNNAAWDENLPDLGWEADAIAVSTEQDREDFATSQLREAMERANNVNAYSNPKFPRKKVAMPDDVYPPAL